MILVVGDSSQLATPALIQPFGDVAPCNLDNNGNNIGPNDDTVTAVANAQLRYDPQPANSNLLSNVLPETSGVGRESTASVLISGFAASLAQHQWR